MQLEEITFLSEDLKRNIFYLEERLCDHEEELQDLTDERERFLKALPTQTLVRWLFLGKVEEELQQSGLKGHTVNRRGGCCTIS